MKKLWGAVALFFVITVAYGFSLQTAIPDGTDNQVLTARTGDTPHWSSSANFQGVTATSLNAVNSLSLNGTPVLPSSRSKGDLFGFDTNGQPVAISPGTSGTVLTSNGAGSLPTFQGTSQGSTTAPVYIGYVGGTQASITASPSPAVSAYVTGGVYNFISTAASSTQGFLNAPTLKINSLEAKQITDISGSAIDGSAWASGDPVSVMYDGTYFRQISTTGLKTQMGLAIVSCNTVGTSTVTVGGLRFKPSLLSFTFGDAGGNGASIGWDNGSNAAGTGYNDWTVQNLTQYVTTLHSFNWNNTIGSYCQGNITNISENSFTVTVTTVGGGVGNKSLNWTAFR